MREEFGLNSKTVNAETLKCRCEIVSEPYPRVKDCRSKTCAYARELENVFPENTALQEAGIQAGFKLTMAEMGSFRIRLMSRELGIKDCVPRELRRITVTDGSVEPKSDSIR